MKTNKEHLLKTSFYTSVERYGNNILYIGYEDGKRVQRKIKYQPTLYIRTKDGQSGDYTSLTGNVNLRQKTFETMSETKEFLERYKEVEGFSIYGNTNYVAAFVQEMFPGKIEFDPSLVNLFQFDIETDAEGGYANINTADKSVTAISIKSSKKDKYYLLTLTEYDKTKTITGIDPEKIYHIHCENEMKMLSMFMKIWESDYPDIVTGWNVEYYDIQYIFTRIIKLFGEDRIKKLSPWGSVNRKTIERFGKQQHTYEISGISVVDFMDAFKKFGYKYGPQESYKLDHISHVVLGEKKLSYAEYGNLANLYKENPQLYNDYALKDTYLIQRMENETALISLVMTIAYKSGVNYADTFGTVGIWETTLFRKLMLDNIVPPVKGSPGMRSSELVGGYVKQPVVGMYKNVVTFDLVSLYPKLMCQYNMGPDTVVIGSREMIDVEDILDGTYVNEDPNYSVSANGVKFSKEKIGVIPSIINEYFANRKAAKTEMLKYESLEQEIKRELITRGINP